MLSIRGNPIDPIFRIIFTPVPLSNEPRVGLIAGKNRLPAWGRRRQAREDGLCRMGIQADSERVPGSGGKRKFLSLTFAPAELYKRSA